MTLSAKLVYLLRENIGPALLFVAALVVIYATLRITETRTQSNERHADPDPDLAWTPPGWTHPLDRPATSW